MFIKRNLIYSFNRSSLKFFKTKMSSKHLDVSSAIDKKGTFVRKDSAFRDFIAEGGEFAPEPNRYHLYVSYACPWAHRALIMRRLKGLEKVISVTCVDYLMGSNGWRFNEKVDGCEADPVFGATFLKEIYKKVSPSYEGRITVPILFDKKSHKIVNNESSEIIRMLNISMNKFCETDEQKSLDFYPKSHQRSIDEVNSWIYENINNGVYKSGFAQSQNAYDEAVTLLFKHLDKVEDILSKQRYICGSQITEGDIRLFTTLVRFDLVYHGHFKCNKKRIIDYPNMWPYLRDLFQQTGFGDTTNKEHICKHYQMSHTNINPFGIVYIGPDLDFSEPHGRNNKFLC